MKKLLAIILLSAFAIIMAAMFTGCNAKKKLVDTYASTDHSKIQTADSAHVQKANSETMQDSTKTLQTDSGTVTITSKTDITTRFDTSGRKTAQTQHTETTTLMHGTIKTAVQNNTRVLIANKSDSAGKHLVIKQKDIKSKGRHVDVVTKPVYGWIAWAIGAVILVIVGIFLIRKFI